MSVTALSPGPSHSFSFRRYRAAEHSRAAVCREPEYSGKKVVAKGIIHITPQTEIRCTQPSAAASAQDRVESGTLPTRPVVVPARVHFVRANHPFRAVQQKSSDQIRNRRPNPSSRLSELVFISFSCTSSFSSCAKRALIESEIGADS